MVDPRQAPHTRRRIPEHPTTSRRAGEEAYIADEDASPKVVSRHFPPKTDRIARNQAFAARMANAKAQVIDEEIGEAARAEAKATTDVKPMRAAAREEVKANKDAAKEGESTTEAKSSSSGSGQ